MQVLKDSSGTVIPVTKTVTKPMANGGRRHQHHTIELNASVEFAEDAIEIIIINRNIAQSMFVNGTEVKGANFEGQYYQDTKDPDVDKLPTFEVTGVGLAYQAIIVY